MRMILELKNLTEFEEGANYWVALEFIGAIKTCVYQKGWFKFEVKEIFKDVGMDQRQQARFFKELIKHKGIKIKLKII